MHQKRLVVAGGGAAGFFAAITAAEQGFRGEIILLEKSRKLLAKVLVSGGGRCNVTHACFDETELATHYPRGEKELRGPFTVFNPRHTMDWFTSKGIDLKTESDGRVFPVSNRSQSIAGCLLEQAEKNKVIIRLESAVTEFRKKDLFELRLADGSMMSCDYLLMATGGGSSSENFNRIATTGHRIITPVPSLFTFNIPDTPFNGLEGIVIHDVIVKIAGTSFQNTGPVLITHWGLSGPCILKLSAKSARYLNEKKYSFPVSLSILSSTMDKNRELILEQRKIFPLRKVYGNAFPGISLRLWQRLCELAGIHSGEAWGQLRKEELNRLAGILTELTLTVSGKTTFKEEFVTCGGIDLKDIHMKTMQSKLVEGLFFAGEIMNVDGFTGGFNFQHAWTSGFIAGKAIAGLSAQ